MEILNFEVFLGQLDLKNLRKRIAIFNTSNA